MSLPQRLALLLDIIKIIHNKQKKNTGFTKPFDFTKYVNKLPYVDIEAAGVKLSSRRVKTFIDEYRKYCDDEYIDYDDHLYQFQLQIAFHVQKHLQANLSVCCFYLIK